MPNLHSRDSFEFDFGEIAIVSGNQARLQQIMYGNPAASALLTGFGHCLGAKLSSALIYRNEQEFLNPWDAMVDARNCLAVACSSFGWIQSIGHKNNLYVRDTDHFDFFPRWPSKDGNHLLYRGPALNLCTSDATGFQGMTYPYLPVNFLVQPVHDENLLPKLKESWRRIHVMRQPTDCDLRLFRALSVAYEACRAPQAMDNPIYDHGKHCSLWVSAFETLAHSGKKGGFEQVVKLIGDRQLIDPKLRREKRIKLGDKKYNLNAAQRLYRHLHRARNAFLHGNHLSIRTFVPKHLAKGIRLLDVAPLVFHTALEAYFTASESNGASSIEDVDMVRSFLRTNPLEDGYLRALGLNR